MAAAGRVTTGFSLPYVAKYAVSGSTVTYSDGQKLARGVNVTISPEASSDNIFYADNVAAETAGGRFTSGTFTLVVDGLFDTAEKLIMNLPAQTGGWYDYDNTITPGYFGLGFIVRTMSDGVTKYVPYVLTKVSFDPIETAAATQEEDISWQTQNITGRIMRDDSSTERWKRLGIEYGTEAAAEAALKTALSIS